MSAAFWNGILAHHANARDKVAQANSTPVPAAKVRLETSVWDSRALPLKDDIRAVLASHDELLEVARMVVEAANLAGFSGPLGDAARAAIAKARGEA